MRLAPQVGGEAFFFFPGCGGSRYDRKNWIELVDAAAALRISYHLCHRWALEGRLKAKRSDGRWFADARDTARLVRERAEAQMEAAAHAHA